MSLIVILFKGGVQLRIELSVGHQVDGARRDFRARDGALSPGPIRVFNRATDHVSKSK